MSYIDIKLDNSYVPVIRNGDFVLANSEAQDIDLLLTSEPGEFREDPAVGAGLRSWVNHAVDVAQLAKDIRLALQGDGFQAINITGDGVTQLKVNASR